MKLPLKERLSYGLGDFGQQFCNFFVMSYLMFFLTDEMEIPAAAVGTVYMIVRIWDAVNDPMMGAIVDRVNGKGGKARPWIIRAIPLFGLTFIFMFSMPYSLPQWAKIAWFFVGYFFYSIGFTMYLIPYGVLPSVMTVDSRERTVLGTFRDYGANLAGTLVGYLAVALIALFSGKGSGSGYSLTAVCLALLMSIFGLLMWKGTKEHIKLPAPPPGEKGQFKKSLKSLLKNRPAIALVLMCFFWMSFYEFRLLINAYHCTYYLNNSGAEATLLMCLTLMPLFCEPFVPALAKRIGKRVLLCMSCALISVGGIMFLIAGTNLALCIVASLILSLSSGILGPLLWGCLPDAADYGEWKSGGVSNPGIIYSINSFAQKLSGSIATFVLGIVLTLVHYDGALEVQPATVGTGIYWFNGIVNIIFGVAAFVCCLLYNLTDEEMEQIRIDLEARRNRDLEERK